MNPMKDLEIKQMDSKREMEVMDALDQVRASNARIDKAARELNPDEILELVRRDEVVVETEEEKLTREDARIAKQAFEGANGETVRRIVEPSPSIISEDKISPTSLLQQKTSIPN